jgi:hypothetical protein
MDPDEEMAGLTSMSNVVALVRVTGRQARAYRPLPNVPAGVEIDLTSDVLELLKDTTLGVGGRLTFVQPDHGHPQGRFLEIGGEYLVFLQLYEGHLRSPSATAIFEVQEGDRVRRMRDDHDLGRVLTKKGSMVDQSRTVGQLYSADHNPFGRRVHRASAGGCAYRAAVASTGGAGPIVSAWVSSDRGSSRRDDRRSAPSG